MPTAHLGGSGGMLPHKILEISTLRVFLMHSGSSFGSELVEILFLQTSRIMTELCCYNFIVWACDKMGGGGGGGGGG